MSIKKKDIWGGGSYDKIAYISLWILDVFFLGTYILKKNFGQIILSFRTFNGKFIWVIKILFYLIILCPLDNVRYFCVFIFILIKILQCEKHVRAREQPKYRPRQPYTYLLDQQFRYLYILIEDIYFLKY